jgi:hypothetical protein
MIFKNLDVRLGGDGGEQSTLDFAAGHIFCVQNAAFGMAAFLAQIEFLGTAGLRNLALREFHAQLDELGDSGRSLLDNRAHDVLVTESRPGLQGVAHVHLERIFLARHRRDATLGVVRVRLGAVLLRQDGHPPAPRDVEREG